jgi:hypothetical protein
VENGNGISETATPHRVSLCETVLSRKGGGEVENGNGIFRNGNGKSFISFWIATGGQSRPRNDGYCHDERQRQIGKRQRHF